MFYGTRITRGCDSWQIYQRAGGKAHVTVGGSWRLEEGAQRAGVASATPSVRLMREDDGSAVFDWLAARRIDENTWEAEFDMPQGGLYRLETCLDAISSKGGEHWRFRGDIRTHIGCGDIFVMAGQSNAAGYGKGVAWDAPDARVHVRRNSGVWDMATHPLNDATDAYDCLNAPMGLTGTSPFISFGRRHADHTGCPVGLLPTAQGGSPIMRWDPKGEGDLFRNMIAKIQHAGGARAIVWYQGCTDAMGGCAETYYERFKRMVEMSRRELGWNIPFYTFQLMGFLGETDENSWNAVREAQRRAAREMKDVFILPTSQCDLADEIHISPASNVRLGEQLAAMMDRGLKAPDLESAEMEEDKLVLHFDNVCGELFMQDRSAHAFSVEDEKGSVPLSGGCAHGDRIVLTLGRKPVGKATVSFGCGAMPPPFPVRDEQTGLAVLAFYKIKI